MKFYNRETEIGTLRKMRDMAYTEHSKLTVVTGRRRIGKTSLIRRAFDDERFIYLFVGRKTESSLCAGFVREIAEKLSLFVPAMEHFADVFRFLMEQGRTRKFTLVIDEFQEFLDVNSSVYSDIQNCWDEYRTMTNVNFIVSGSVYSLMVKIFKDRKEPLFGREDRMLKLQPFTTEVLKRIMQDYNAGYSHDDLLALYTFTGGVPKYVELLVDNKALSIEAMIDYITHPDSPFKDEGKNLLIEEFGKKYATYFSILDCIAMGVNTQSAIEAALADKSIGGQLCKLEDTYEVIRKMRPILAKPRSQTVKYCISDIFLRFWFRYFERNRALIEIGNHVALKKIIHDDYATYSGLILEQYFIEKMKESLAYIDIGSYWEFKKGKEQNEIDIVGLSIEKGKAVAIEVKRQRKNFAPQLFAEKVQHLKTAVLPHYDIEMCCLTLEDM